MSATNWQVYGRKSQNLLEHLCAVRQISVLDLKLDFSQLHDPNLLPGMVAARKLIKQAVTKGWFVTIFGDYDADGTPAAAVLATLLAKLGLKYEVIIPTRAEGYGLKLSDVDKIAERSQLLILVDTGVTAIEPIAALKKLGVQTIVLDHHLPKETLPPAAALIDPYLPGSQYPFCHLCGCALAYKLVTALVPDFPELSEGFQKWLLDLVAISTVADMMVMTGENRVLVHYGLQVLKKTRRPGLKALMAVAGIDPEKLSAGNLGFGLGPRLNAAGRLGDNRPAFELLMSVTDAEAVELATKVEQSNRERQGLVEEVTVAAMKLLFQQNTHTDRCFVLIGDDWPAGVIGLVAGRIAGQFYRPTVILTRQGDEITGSARSVGEYSIIDGLTSQTKLLSRFGGHRQAAGLALTERSLIKFVDGLKAHAAKYIAESQLVKTYLADALLADSEITLATTAVCDQFQPFGMENQSPLFIIKNVQLGPPRFIGTKGDHVKWTGRTGAISLDIVGFGLAERLKAEPMTEANLLGHLEKNIWNNQTKLQFRLVDFQPVKMPYVVI